MIKFYDCQTAPSPRRVRLFIAEKQIEVETIEVDLRNGEHLKPEFEAINPWRTLPVLELDDGTRIDEVTAICRYLELLKPEPPLLGVDKVEQAKVEMWNRHMESDGFFAVAEALRNAAPGFKDRAVTGGDKVPQIPELADRGKARTRRFLDRLDGWLADRDYIVGDRFSIADITAFCAVDFAKWLKLTLPENATNAHAWYDRVAARPAFAQSMA